MRILICCLVYSTIHDSGVSSMIAEETLEALAVKAVDQEKAEWILVWPSKRIARLHDALNRLVVPPAFGEMSNVPFGTGVPEFGLGTHFVLGAQLADTGRSIVHEVTKVDEPRRKLIIKYMNDCTGENALINEFDILSH